MDISLRLPEAADASALLALLDQVAQETEFVALDRLGMTLTPELLGHQLTAIAESPNNLLLVAETSTGELIGTASVTADSDPRTAHIGDVGIAILKEYWGFGIGSLLLDEVLYWAETSGLIRRLELTVQVHNQRAVHLYQRFGFHTEATLSRGARGDDGTFLDVYLMSCLID